MIFGRAVKAISSLGIRSPCLQAFPTQQLELYDQPPQMAIQITRKVCTMRKETRHMSVILSLKRPLVLYIK